MKKRGRKAGTIDSRVTALDIAAALEVYKGHPYLWKQGRHGPSPEVLERAAKVTGVAVDEIPVTGWGFWAFLQGALPASPKKHFMKGRRKKDEKNS